MKKVLNVLADLKDFYPRFDIDGDSNGKTVLS